jgi:hypothetical protein
MVDDGNTEWEARAIDLVDMSIELYKQVPEEEKRVRRGKKGNTM